MEITKEQLEQLEQQFGGYIKDVKRTVISKKEKKLKYYAVHQGGDRMKSKYHNYSKDYEKFLNSYIQQTGNSNHLTIAEIGILTGIGLSTWCELFRDSTIHGLDIDTGIYKRNKAKLLKLGAFRYNEPIINDFDQFKDNKKFIKDNIGNVDIVIDDGCHLDEAIINTFKCFEPYLASVFVYFIEDNQKVHKYFKDMGKYDVYYRNQMTVISRGLNVN